MVALGIVLALLLAPVVAGVVQYNKAPKPPNGLTYAQYKQYYYNREWEHIGDEDENTEDETQIEKRMYLDEAIIKYNKLLESLGEQLKNTYDEKERSKVLAKQITTLEKLTRALEKREKLE